MNSKLAKKAAEVLKVLANPTRLRIVELLQNGELCVSELVYTLEIKEPVASQQLNKMKNKGLLCSQRCGCKVFYYLKDKQMIGELLGYMMDNWKTNHSR